MSVIILKLTKNMKKRKYKIVEDDFIIHKGKKLYRIKALKKVSTSTYKGALGGYVEGYHNLSQEGDCWIQSEAKVYDNARVRDNAQVGGSAEIYGNTVVNSNTRIGGYAKVYENAKVIDHAIVYGKAKIYGNTVIKGGSRVYEESEVFGNAVIEHTVVGNASIIYDNAVLMLASHSALNNVTICGNTEIHD
jgi:UDP-3-O-[3-hydroxymyristoyl] glucosamine N-acyltransferase